MVNPTQQAPRAFVKVFWEIRFFPVMSNPDLSKEEPLPLKNRAMFYISPDSLPTVDAQTLVKLMSAFHKSSKEMVENLLAQAKSLEEFKEEDADRNFEIAKMITWIKMLQDLIERLRKDIK